jgi:hypothetical protein
VAQRVYHFRNDGFRLLTRRQHRILDAALFADNLIGEISKRGVARPLSIKPVKKVMEAIEEDNPPSLPDRTEKRFSVADRLNKILSFIETRYKKKVLIELDSEYTRSNESLKLLISHGWEFKTRIRCDSLIGREVRSHMEASKLDLYGEWYNDKDYGGALPDNRKATIKKQQNHPLSFNQKEPIGSGNNR